MVAGAASGLLAGAACVDLFHSTDWPTLCDLDGSACVDAAEVDSAPSAPVDAGRPPTNFCEWSKEMALARAERACAWLGACHGVLEESTFGRCMVRALAVYDCTFNPTLRPQGETHALWDCLADVGSCADVGACVFGEVPACSSAGGVGTFTSCTEDGETRVQCSAGSREILAIESCLARGRSCVKDTSEQGRCVGKASFACDSAKPSCDGTHAVVCSAGTDVGLDCASVGAGRCVEDDAGVACAPVATAEACDAGSALRCDDAGVVHRCVDEKEITIDCARIDQGCVLAGADPLDPTSACVNRDAAAPCSGDDTCDGDLLRSCVQGRAFEVSCKSLGLGPCELPDGGDPFARCRRP